MDEDELQLYTNYYLSQAGDGFSIFNGSLYNRGYGLGSFLGKPFTKKYVLI
jgi:hypothetical protein